MSRDFTDLFGNDEHGEIAPIVAAGAGVVIDSLGRVWRAWQHPRDHLGRFINTFSPVRVRLKKGGEWNDLSGRVDSINPDGSIYVLIDKVLSPDGKQKFKVKDKVKVSREDLEVLDAKGRIASNPRKYREMKRRQRAAMENNARSLRALRDGAGNPVPEALKAAEFLEKALEAEARVRALKAKRKPAVSEKEVQKAVIDASQALDGALDLLDRLRGGEGVRSGSDNVMRKGQASKEETLFDNAFNQAATAQAFMEGEAMGRLQKGGLLQGILQERGGNIGPEIAPGAEEDLGQVYKDINGKVIDNPVEQERAVVNAERKARGESEVTFDEYVAQYLKSDRMVSPRLVNGLDRVGAVYRRGKENLAARTMPDKYGAEVRPGSLVSVDEGSGRGGGWKREAFVGLVQRVMVDKDGRVEGVVVRDFRPELMGLPEEEWEPGRPKGYYTNGYADYTRLSSSSIEDVTPEAGENYKILMNALQGDFGVTIDQLSKAMVSVNGGRRFAGANAGRLSELVQDGGISILDRRKVDGNGQLLQVGDWVYSTVHNGYGQINYMEPGGNTIGIQINGEGEAQRLSSRKVAFSHSATGAVFGREADAINTSGLYAPTKSEAAAVARRLGLDDIADAIESGGNVSEVAGASDGWAAFSAASINLRGKMYDRAGRGLSLSPEEQQVLQDNSILAAAISGLYREGTDLPSRKVEIPDSAVLPENIPAAPEGVFEGLDIPEGQTPVANPANENSVFVVDEAGDVNEFLRDPATGEWVNAGPPEELDEPTDSYAPENEVPDGFERRTNGRGLKDAFYTPDGRIQVQENKRGQLQVTDVSDPAEPDVLGVVEDWDDALDLIENMAPDSLPSGEKSIQEIYNTREQKARERLSENLGEDISEKSAEEIVGSEAYIEASQGDNYGQIAFDLNEIDAAEAVTAGEFLDTPDEIEEVTEPEPEPDVVPEPESVETPAEQPEEDTRPGKDNIAEGLESTLWSLAGWLKNRNADPATISKVEDVARRLGKAVDDQDAAAARKVLGEALRVEGLPKNFVDGLARDLEAVDRGDIALFDADGAGKDPFEDQRAPIKFSPIEPVDDFYPVEAVEFLEDFLNTPEKWLDYFIAENQKQDKFWTTEKQRAKNEDIRKGFLEAQKMLKKALENPDLSDEERQEAATAALLRAANTARRFMGEAPGYVAVFNTLAAKTKSFYNSREKSEELLGDSDLAEELTSDPIFEILGGDIPGDQYVIVNESGEAFTEGFIAEVPETRLAFPQGELSEEAFVDYWNNVLAPALENAEGVPSGDVAVFIVTDDEGRVIVSAGVNTDDEDAAASLAALNEDSYYSAAEETWKTPEAPVNYTEPVPETEDRFLRGEGEDVAEGDAVEDAAPEEVSSPKTVQKLKLTPAMRTAIVDNAESLGAENDKIVRELLSGKRQPSRQEDFDLLSLIIDSARYGAERMLEDSDRDPSEKRALRTQIKSLNKAEERMDAVWDEWLSIPRASISEPQIDTARERLRSGGYTIDLSTGQDEFTEGFSVSLPGREVIIPEDEMGDNRKVDRAIRNFVDDNGEILNEERYTFGSWLENGEGFLDVSEVIDDVVEAMQVGRERKQIAIYDFARGGSIYLNEDGTGTLKRFDDNGNETVVGTYDAEGNFTDDSDAGPDSPGGGDDGGLPPSGGGDAGGGGSSDDGGRGGPSGGGGNLATEVTAESVASVAGVDLSDTPDAVLPDTDSSPVKVGRPEGAAAEFAVAGDLSLKERLASAEAFAADGYTGAEVVLDELFGREVGNPVEWLQALRLKVGEGSEVDSAFNYYLARPENLAVAMADPNDVRGKSMRRDPTGPYAVTTVAEFAKSLLVLIPSNTTDPVESQVRANAENYVRALAGYGYTASPENPFTDEEKTNLQRAENYAREQVIAGSGIMAEDLVQISVIQSIGDAQSASTWGALDTIWAPENSIPGLSEFASSIRERVEWLDPTSSLVTDAVPELGLPETAPGEVSLASVAKTLLDPEVVGADVTDPDEFYRLLTSMQNGLKGTNDGFLQLKNGIRVRYSPDADEEGGINEARTFWVYAGDTPFILKYDSEASAAAEVVVPRILESFGQETPTVVPLSTDYGDMSTIQLFGGAREAEGVKRLPFLQNVVAYGEEGRRLVGREDANRENLADSYAGVLEDPEASESVDTAESLLKTLFGNFVAGRYDTHSGNNLAVVEPDGQMRVVPIDNGLAFPSLTNSNMAGREWGTYDQAKTVLNNGSSYILKEWRKRASKESIKRLQDSLAEWAQDLRSWYETRALTPVNEGGILTGNKLDRYLRQWFEDGILPELDDLDALWDTLTQGSYLGSQINADSYLHVDLFTTEGKGVAHV